MFPTYDPEAMQARESDFNRMGEHLLPMADAAAGFSNAWASVLAS